MPRSTTCDAWWDVALGNGHWVQLRSDGGATLAFQRAPDLVPPD